MNDSSYEVTNGVATKTTDQIVIKSGDDFTKLVIKLQSMLQTLLREEVRDDFKCGKIIQVHNPGSILASIDVIRGLIFPDWNVPKMQRSIDIDTAELHLKLLWQKSTSNFDLQGNHQELENYSYSAWIEAFEELFSSPYWDNMNKIFDDQLVSWREPDMAETYPSTSLQVDLDAGNIEIKPKPKEMNGNIQHPIPGFSVSIPIYSVTEFIIFFLAEEETKFFSRRKKKPNLF